MSDIKTTKKASIREQIEKYTDSLIGHLKKAGTIEELPHVIIQNVVSKDPDKIEKVATTAIKAGFEVEDPEFFEDDLLEGDLFHNLDDTMNEQEARKVIIKGEYYSLDICTLHDSLNRDLIIEQSLQVEQIAHDCECIYCGWGSFVEDDPEEDEDELYEEEIPNLTI